MECYKQATNWTPGTKRREHPLHDAFQLYEPDFIDSDDTVIIIDEFRNHRKFITASGSSPDSLKPILSLQVVILEEFMIRSFAIPAVMSPNSPSIRFLLKSF